MHIRFVSQMNRNNRVCDNSVSKVVTVGIADVKLPGFVDYEKTIRSVTTQHFSQSDHPNIIQHQVDCNFLETPLDFTRSVIVEQRLVDAISKLAAVKANLILIPDSRLSNYVRRIRQRFPELTILSVADIVPKACMQMQHAKVGLMGDQFVMANYSFRSEFEYTGIRTVVPCRQSQKSMQDALIVLRHTPVGYMHQDTLNGLIAVVSELKDEGCDAVVVTHPIVAAFLKKSNCGVPIIDTTAMLAEVAVNKVRSIHQEQISCNRLRASL